MSSAHVSVPGHAHHFETREQQFEAAKQGMWIFLVTEVLMFGGLFVAYVVFRGWYVDMFHEAHRYLSVAAGATNTVVLITSSLTMMLAVSATQRGDRKRAQMFLWFTLILAFAFFGVKYWEYSHKIHDGLLPGALFTNTELKDPKAPLFFSLYFVMTGLHGLHVAIGIGLIAWIMRRNARNEFNPVYYTPVEIVGFYWHFVDLVWIYLFPLMYLVP
jgi:cytochrome c oxidase subunit 3